MTGALLLALLAGGQQGAPASSVEFDLQCMLLLAAMVGSGDAELSAASQGPMHYYAGRVDALIPPGQIEERAWAATQALAAADRGAIARACGERLEERGRVFAEIGRRIEERERAAGQSQR